MVALAWVAKSAFLVMVKVWACESTSAVMKSAIAALVSPFQATEMVISLRVAPLGVTE